MRTAHLPPNELQRLQALRSYELQDASNNDAYSALVRLAAHICNAPIAYMALVDEEEQWTKACFGMQLDPIPRDLTFCTHAILDREILEVPDARKDERFADNPLVLGEPHIRFYAGAPLITREGYALGTVCVVDREPRILDESQRMALRNVATAVVGLIEASARAPEALARKLQLFSTAVEHAYDAVIVLEMPIDAPEKRRITYVNDRFVEVYGHSRHDVLGEPPSILYGPKTSPDLAPAIVDALKHERSYHAEAISYRADRTPFWVDLSFTPMRVANSNDSLYAIALARDISQERRTREELRLLWSAVQDADDAFFVHQSENGGPWRTVYVNDAMSRMTGYEREELLRDSTLGLLVGEHSERSLISRFFATSNVGESLRTELQLFKRSGEPFWAEVVARSGMQGETTTVVGVARDVTARKQAEERVALLTEALEQSSDMMVIHEVPSDPEGIWKIVYVNRAFEQSTGFSREELIGSNLGAITKQARDGNEFRHVRKRMWNGERARGELRFFRKDGTEFWVEGAAQPIMGGSGRASHVVISFRDITAVKQLQDALSYEAAHDPLTGLFNRRYFERSIEQTLADARRTGTPHCLAVMDLDEFKPINDRYGHDAGDAMLKAVAQALGHHIRHGDVLARIGGDEFAVILHECNLESASRLVDMLLRQVRSCSLEWKGETLHVGASVGLVPITTRFEHIGALLRAGDELCYHAKRSGRNRVSLFEPVGEVDGTSG